MTVSARIFRLLFPNEVNHFEQFRDIVKMQMANCHQVLDLGCGDNSLLAEYRSPDRGVWGTDFSEHPRLQDRRWFRPLARNGEIPFPDATFDLVVSVSVLEHVIDGQAFFNEVARVLKPSGHFIGQSISGQHYVTWIRRAFGLMPHSFNQLIVKTLYGRDEADTFPAFYRLNSQSTIETAARKAGLACVNIIRYADPGYFRFFRPLLPIAILTDWALARISSSWGCLYFTVIMLKPGDTTNTVSNAMRS